MESSSTVPAWLIVVPIIIVWPIFFLALWSAILFFMSAAGGWRRLARTYATADAPVGGRTFSGITGMIGVARYKRTLIVTTNDAGLYLKTRRVFSIFHTPLFIPWSEISNPQSSNFLRVEFIAFDIGKPVVARIKLQSSVFEDTPLGLMIR